jgi:cytochrome c556
MRGRKTWFTTSMVAALIAVAAASSCATTEEQEQPRVGGEHMHYRPAIVNMADVMQVKLIHTQAIVEGLALGDMRQVAVNAESLHGLSSRASWMVHDTVTYVAMSETFRETVSNLQTQAQAGDADAAMAAYLDMTRSCLDCHTYLREERRFKDAPGRRSMILDQLVVQAGRVW